MTYYIGNYKNRPRRVVFYGRVSTEHEEQLSALGNQMEWYTDLALRNPNWTVVAQYIDEGITGTQMKKRPSFIEKVVEKIRFAVLLCIRRFQTSEKVNSVLCCTVLGKQRHDWIPRACQDARKHIAWLQSDARQSAGKGCLSGICRGRETHSYNDRSCRGGKTSTALLCRYGMTLDLLFESVNGNIIIRMRNRP